MKMQAVALREGARPGPFAGKSLNSHSRNRAVNVAPVLLLLSSMSIHLVDFVIARLAGAKFSFPSRGFLELAATVPNSNFCP